IHRIQTMFGPSILSPARTVLRTPIIKPTRALRLIPNLSKFKTIEQPPGYIVGTVNDAYKPPSPVYYEGSYHWTYERIIAITMLPLVMTPFAAGVEYPMIDSIFSTLLLFHCHAGIKSCIIDYIPKRVYGFWYGAASKVLTFGTFVAMYGIYVLETSSNGLFDLVKAIWSA
ncbi:MAG: CybS family protein, partial [Asgard group archaeon]|nr:CybS family protein [Asgard group archaeon]